MNLLKQSTAATIKLGPFIDDGDGKSAETGLTISQADIRLSKNGGDFAQTNNAAGATHDEFGYYDIPLDTTDTNTLGRLRVAVSESGALPVWQDFLVVTANVYDTLCSTDTFDVNVATIATDAITAAALKADAVTEIQNGLALEATLTAIKGAGWTNETLVNIMALVDEAEQFAESASGYAYASDAALTDIKGTGWTNETLVKIVADIAAIRTQDDWTLDDLMTAIGSGATAAMLTDIHDTDLPAVKTAVDAILVDTGTTIPALLETIDNFLDTEVAAILEDTGTTLPASIAAVKAKTDQLTFTVANKVDATATTDTSSIAGDVWSHATRTLTVPAVAAAATENGTTLTLYKDADINIEFTGLTIPTGAKKVVFTIKDNLDDADTASALQATYQLTDVPAETHTLNYINSATPPTLTNPVTFTVTTDSVEFDMTAAAAYYLPRYERGYLKWDLKLITDTTVQILQQGLVQILGTSTRTVA
jgi:hypothetical protein